jgi:hypothetical protein
MEDDSDTHREAAQRVAILSTLASGQRPPRATPAGRRRIRAALTKHWQLKMLMGMMVFGIVVSLAAFTLMLTQGTRPERQVALAAEAITAQPDSLGQTGSKGGRAAGRRQRADTGPNPLAALIASPSDAPASVKALLPAPSPAVIEDVPTAAGPAPAEPEPSPIAPPVVAKPVQTAMASPARPDQHALRSARLHADKPLPHKTRKPDDDVALLEAMLAHTGAAPHVQVLSAAEEIRSRCNALHGADAATCRARVCVQHPTASVCHTDP